MSSLKENIQAAAVGSVFTLLVLGAGYILTVRDNAKDIEHLTEKLSELEVEQKGHIGRLEGDLKAEKKRVGQMRIFVATMHPDRYAPHLASAEKLGELSPEELENFVSDASEALPYYELVRNQVGRLDDDRVNTLLEELKQKGPDETLENVAKKLGLDEAQLEASYKQGNIKQILEKRQLNVEDLNFALKVMATESAPESNDELAGKRNELVESLMTPQANFHFEEAGG